MKQPGLPLEFQILPTYQDRFRAKEYPHPVSFFVGTNLQTKPTFDGFKMSRYLRRFVIKGKKGVQESFNNVHYFPLEQERINRIKVFLTRRNGETILFRGASVVVTLRFRYRQHTLTLRSRQT